MNISAPANLDHIEAYTLEVIYTFDEGPQQIGRLPFFGEVSEANALHAVLSQLSDAERQSLVKVSLCLYCEDPEPWPWPWLKASNGKYCFATGGANQ